MHGVERQFSLGLRMLAFFHSFHILEQRGQEAELYLFYKHLFWNSRNDKERQTHAYFQFSSRESAWRRNGTERCKHILSTFNRLSLYDGQEQSKGFLTLAFPLDKSISSLRAADWLGGSCFQKCGRPGRVLPFLGSSSPRGQYEHLVGSQSDSAWRYDGAGAGCEQGKGDLAQKAF